MTTFRNVSSALIERVKNKFSLSYAPKHLKNVVKPEHKEIVYKKLIDLNAWYTRLLGLDEVKFYQDRVIKIQDQLMQTQEKRREVGKQLSEIRKKSNALQDELMKVKRRDDLDKYLALMREETEVLQLEHDIHRTFQEYDQAERENFTAFANAIRDSHEKQRAQLEYTKYFGLVLSIVGSFLAFCYTTFKKQDLRYYLENSLGVYNSNIDELKVYLQKLDNYYQVESLLQGKGESKIDSSNPNPVKNATDEVGKTYISLGEPYVTQENTVIRCVLFAGLALLLLKVLCPN